MKNHDDFGQLIGGGRWFNRQEETREVAVRPVRVEWPCPACEVGTMVYTGEVWPTGDPGYHHLCSNTECRFTAAVHKKYPRIEYLPV